MSALYFFFHLTHRKKSGRVEMILVEKTQNLFFGFFFLGGIAQMCEIEPDRPFPNFGAETTSYFMLFVRRILRILNCERVGRDVGGLVFFYCETFGREKHPIFHSWARKMRASVIFNPSFFFCFAFSPLPNMFLKSLFAFSPSWLNKKSYFFVIYSFNTI